MAAPVTISEVQEPVLRTDPIATRLVALYVFLLFCRILEMLPFFGLGHLRLMVLVTMAALLVVFLTGNLVRALRTSIGALLIAWTAWMVVCMPFSTWRSETLDQFLNNWLKSLMVFFIVAGLASTTSAFEKVTAAMGWAAAAACHRRAAGHFGRRDGQRCERPALRSGHAEQSKRNRLSPLARHVVSGAPRFAAKR